MLVNPLLPDEAPDPCVVRHDGAYFLTATVPPFADRLVIWRSETLGGFGERDAARAVVWTAPPTGLRSRSLWAPELHRLDGRWYLHHCASDDIDANHRQYVLEAKTDDPLGPWVDRGRVDPEFDRYAIDGTVIELPNGSRWFAWTTGELWIAPMTSPTRVRPGGPRVRIAAPNLRWEGSWLEAPQALIHHGRVFVSYSAGHSGTPDYRVGFLELLGDDPLDTGAWRKSRVPLLEPDPDAGAWTTGHCSFTTSPDGTEDWIVYHAKDTTSLGFGGRTARAQRLTWTANGLPFVGRPVPLGVPLQPPSGE
ncbi:MAG TPA: glycoside hydrolase family 43 protein [Acidimicrobiales bacterium]|nr:glycoside hydrolase family 43 protein [Acidimicrobiales bacterium]